MQLCSHSVDGNSRNNDAIQRSRDDFAAAFNISLPTILQRWSSVALKVLDNQIKYTGKHLFEHGDWSLQSIPTYFEKP